MNTIKTLLCATPLEGKNYERVRAALPDTEILLHPYMKAPEADVQRADVIFGNVTPAFLDNCPALRWVQLSSAGADEYVPHVPENVLFTNATGAYGPAIAEHMLGMLLMLQKKFHVYRDFQNARIWKRCGMVTGIEGCTCLVIGLGDLGGCFAQKMKALGAYTIGVRRSGTAKPDFVDELYLSDAIPALLPRADVVALCLPNTPATRHMADEAFFAAMKESAIFLNTGRGTAVDQSALIAALETGHLAAAGLDVADPEPLPPEHPLWRARNCFITPHSSGGWTLASTVDRAVDIFLDNLPRYLAGEPLRNVVDRATGYRRTV